MVDRLNEIRERAGLASVGPWEYSPDNYGDPSQGPQFHTIRDADECVIATTDYTQYGNDDADFIAHAREDIPWLLAEIERLNGLLESTEEILEATDGQVESRRVQWANRGRAVLGHNEETTP